jgi:hypothetical protein
MVLPNPTGFLHKRLVKGPPLEPTTTTATAPETPAPLSSPGSFSQARRTQLAHALHTRWHGDGNAHVPQGKTAADCAELSGAFTDADTCLELVALWTTEADAAHRRALLEAAAMVDRLARIATTRQRDVHPADLRWWEAEPQASLRRAFTHQKTRTTTDPLLAVGTWLRALAKAKP